MTEMIRLEVHGKIISLLETKRKVSYLLIKEV